MIAADAVDDLRKAVTKPKDCGDYVGWLFSIYHTQIMPVLRSKLSLHVDFACPRLFPKSTSERIVLCPNYLLSQEKVR
jgi:hypothetical protein